MRYLSSVIFLASCLVLMCMARTSEKSSDKKALYKEHKQRAHKKQKEPKGPYAKTQSNDRKKERTLEGKSMEKLLEELVQDSKWTGNKESKTGGLDSEKPKADSEKQGSNESTDLSSMEKIMSKMEQDVEATTNKYLSESTGARKMIRNRPLEKYNWNFG